MCENNCEECRYKLFYENIKKTSISRVKQKALENVKNGKCSHCGVNDLAVKKGKRMTLCEECLKKQREVQKKYKERLTKKNEDNQE